jgi:hypothetical protein
LLALTFCLILVRGHLFETLQHPMSQLTPLGSC